MHNAKLFRGISSSFHDDPRGKRCEISADAIADLASVVLQVRRSSIAPGTDSGKTQDKVRHALEPNVLGFDIVSRSRRGQTLPRKCATLRVGPAGSDSQLAVILECYRVRKCYNRGLERLNFETSSTCATLHSRDAKRNGEKQKLSIFIF